MNTGDRYAYNDKVYTIDGVYDDLNGGSIVAMRDSENSRVCVTKEFFDEYFKECHIKHNVGAWKISLGGSWCNGGFYAKVTNAITGEEHTYTRENTRSFSTFTPNPLRYDEPPYVEFTDYSHNQNKYYIVK